MPLPGRWLTSLLVRHNGRMSLIDCGEGTQIPLKLAGWGFKNIDAVLFTHYHADHIAGLPGFLLTLGNSGRTGPLSLIGPPGLAKVVAGLTVVSPELPYELKIIELPYNGDAQIKSTDSDDGTGQDAGNDHDSDDDTDPDTGNDHDFDQDAGADSDDGPGPEAGASIPELLLGDILVRCLPVDHNLPCLAYTMELKRKGRFDVERARQLGVPVDCWNALQKGRPIQLGDRTISPDMVLGEPRKGIKVSYCTDTRPTDGLAGFVKDSDLFICEGMYGDDEDAQKAILKKHMTFSEAAVLARQANVKELWLTHFSPSLTNPQAYGDAAGAIFENAVAGKDLMTKTIRFEEE